MTTTNGNRKLLDLKRWEPVSPLQIPANQYNGSLYSGQASLRHIRNMVFHFASSSSQDQIYDVTEDGWSFTVGRTISNSGNLGSMTVGHVWSTGSTVGATSLTATAGTTTTITTNQTLARDLRGWPIHILSGPNAGATLIISSNTIGANAVITVPTQATAFSASTTYRLMTPRWYIVPSYATPIFRAYDWATNTYLTLSTTNMPAGMSSFTYMAATPSWRDSDYLAFATGTATSATGTTLVNTAKAWTTNQWTNYQVRIVSGTGAGQIRTISSNTGTTLTVPTWTTTPDNTSVYSIEGNDDFIYMAGQADAKLYRYSISTNTWTVLLASGMINTQGSQFLWPCTVTDSAWTNESSIQNGRYIYYFTGQNNSGLLNIYDITTNSTSSITVAMNEQISNSASYSNFYIHNNIIYLFTQPGSTSYTYFGRIVAFDVVTKNTVGIGRAPSGSSLNYSPMYNGMWVSTYKDGTTSIDFLYFTSSIVDGSTSPSFPMYRMMLI
jgi:hypothetical protein